MYVCILYAIYPYGVLLGCAKSRYCINRCQ